MRKDDTALRNEHNAVRERVGYHDFTHQLMEVTGPDADRFMDKMFVNDISGAKIGQGKYTSMLNEDGEIIDDVIIFHIDEQLYWISTLDIQFMLDWFGKYDEGFDVNFEDITDVTTMYAVQGPDSLAVLNKILAENIDDLKFTRIIDNKIDDLDVKVARFGFTGELGFELYFTPENKEFVEEKLEDAGAEFDIKEIETDVFLTSLPTEKGLKIMRDYEGLDPVEAGLSWSIDWDSDFIGKEAIQSSKEDGPRRSLIGFIVDDDAAEVELESDITKDGDVVGRVTNYTYGYTAGQNIGFAVIENDKVKIGDKVMIGDVEATLTSDKFVE
jgi:aminomethyltransferase